MSQTVVLFWMSTLASRPDFQPDIALWAEREKIVLEAERPNSGRPKFGGYDRALVDRIEAWLDQARSAAGALEHATALELLSQIETSLQNHPELPQAAWLMAEHHHLLADVKAHVPESAQEAEQLRAAARALEADRSSTFSEQATASKATSSIFSVTLLGLDTGDTVEWDGKVVARSVETSAGEHQLRIVRRGRLLHAAWTAVPPGTTELTLKVPVLVPCSPDDLTGAKIDGRRAVARTGTRCASWAMARPSAGSGIEVARCSADRCGPLVRFTKPRVDVAAKPKHITPESKWSPWATYTLLGVGAVAGASIVLWQAGVFDSPDRQTKTTWEYGGLESAGFEF